MKTRLGSSGYGTRRIGVINHSAATWPPESQVLLGVVYGPHGTEYTGTLNATAVRMDLDTGNLYKPIGTRLLIKL